MSKKLNLDPEQIRKMASVGCTTREIADILSCDEATVRKNFRVCLEKGRAQMRRRLRMLQWKSAKAGNVAALIWLGKQYLEQTDAPKEPEVPIKQPVLQIVRPGATPAPATAEAT